MTQTTQRIAAALAAVLIATSSIAAIVTVPAADGTPAVATMASPEIA